MKPTLIDTDTPSLFFRNHPVVVSRFAEYAREHRSLNISIITYNEVLSGLLHRDARRQMESFRSFVEVNRMLPLSESAVSIAAQMYAESRKTGQPVDDIDILKSLPENLLFMQSCKLISWLPVLVFYVMAHSHCEQPQHLTRSRHSASQSILISTCSQSKEADL